MKRGSLSLIYSECVAFVICTFLVSSSTLHANPDEDLKIRQVTDNNNNNNELLGTATEIHFKSFVEEYGKEYSSREEYVHRLGVFAKNLLRAAEHQAMDPTAVHGVTEFSDLTEDEFEKMYMGVKGGSYFSHQLHEANRDSTTTMIEEVGDLPENFDWRDHGAVTEVKTQVMQLISLLFIFIMFFFC